MKKKIMYLFLITIMLFGINVNALNYSVPNNEPVGFSDKSHPYGSDDSDESFIFNKDDMILTYSYDQNKGGTAGRRYYDLDNQVKTTKNILESGKEMTIATLLSKSNYLQSVSFGPTNSLLDSYIAYLGVDKDKNLKINIVKDGIVINTTTLGSYELSWIAKNDVGQYYQMLNMFSITAGDYNKDGKDTIVVAYNHTHNVYLMEFSYDVNTKKLNKTYETDKLFNEQFLSSKTSNSNPYDLFEENHKDQYGSNKLSVELKTGDLNNDGYDDLVVLSYANFCDNYDNYDYRIFTPYLAVSIGNVKFKLDKNTGAYVNTQTLRTVLGAGFDLVDTNNDQKDEIIVAGGSTSYIVKNNKLSSFGKATKYGIAKFELDSKNNLNNTFFLESYDLDKYTSNNMSYTSDRVFSRTSVLGAHLQGANAPEQVFINGNIYTINGQKITKETNFTNLDKESNRSVGLYQAIKGNFNNDNDRKDSIRFVTILKESGEDDYNFYYTEVKYIDVDSISYTDSYKFIDNKGDNLDECLNGLIVSGDFNEDSLILQYNKKDYRYADMDILVMLQATPYFEDIEDYYNNFGGTTYSISREVNMSNSKGNSVAFGVSLYTSFSVGTPLVKSDISITEGYSLNWNKTFTTTHSYEIEESWTATTDDTVVIYYVPIISYYYNVYDVELNTWVPNGFVISMESNPVYEQKTVDQYNELVDSYNTQLKNSKPKEYDKLKLTEINLSKSYLGVSGNLHKYPKIGTNNVQTYGKTLNKASSSDSLASVTYSSGIEEGFSTEIAHGFNFGLSVGVSAGVASSGNSVAAGVETNLEYMNSKAHDESVKNTVEIEANVGNYKGTSMIADGYSKEQSEAYTFDWQLAKWDSNVKMNGEPIKVVGYAVQNITELPGKVQELTIKPDIDKTKNIVNSIELSWEASTTSEVEPTYYIVYLEKDGNWEELVKTKELKYSYKDKNGFKEDSYTFRVVSAREYYDNNNNKTLLVSLDSIETAYVHIDGFTIYEIKKIQTKTDENGNKIDVYQFVLSNGKTVDFEITNGKDGKNGIDGKDGKDALTPQLRINSETNEWEVSYDGKTWKSLGFSASGEDGKNGKDGKTPQMRFNEETSAFEVSYDDGNTWNQLMEMSALLPDSTAVTPLMRINPNTNEWEVSYDNGLTYKSLNVKATGENGQDGTTTVIEVAVAATVATSGAAAGAFYILKKKAIALIAK